MPEKNNKDKCLVLLYNTNRTSWQHNAFSIMIQYLSKYREVETIKIECEPKPKFCDFLNIKYDKDLDCKKCNDKKFFKNLQTIHIDDFKTKENEKLNYLVQLPKKLNNQEISRLTYKNYCIGKPILCSLMYILQSEYKDKWDTMKGSLAYNTIEKAIQYFDSFTKIFHKNNQIKYLYIDDINKVMWRIPMEIASGMGIKCIVNLRSDFKKNNLVTYQVFSRIEEFFKDNSMLPCEEKICSINNFDKNSLINYGKKFLDQMFILKDINNNNFNDFKVRIKPYKYKFCIFLNCFFDVGLQKDESIFDSFFEYLEFTIKHIRKCPSTVAIFKLHPLEKIFSDKTNLPEKIIDLCLKYKLNNFEILDSESNITTYHLSDLIDVGITLCGSVIAELNYKGKQVLCVSCNGLSNRGCGIFVETKETYKNYLKDPNLIPSVNDSNKQNAQLLTGLQHSDFLYLKFSNSENFNTKLTNEEVDKLLEDANVNSFLNSKF